MYICVCKAVTAAIIENAFNEGRITLKSQVSQLKVGTQCGKCIPFVKEELTRLAGPKIAHNQPRAKHQE